MTKEKIHQLETDVAVIKNNMHTLKQDANSVKSLLRWFIVISASILVSIAVNIWSVAGHRRVQSILTENIRTTSNHNSKVINDIVTQGIENGCYKPSKNMYIAEIIKTK